MSNQEYSKVIKSSKLSKDKKATEMVRRVGQRVAKAVDDLLTEEGIEMKFDWEFNLIEDNQGSTIGARNCDSQSKPTHA